MVAPIHRARKRRPDLRPIDPKADHVVYGVSLVEFPTDEARRRTTSLMDRCPHVDHVVLVDDGRSAMVTFLLPEGKEEWLRLIERRPDLIDADRATVHVPAEVVHPSHIDLRVPPVRGETAPCGVCCARCPFFKLECPGCIFTTAYTMPRSDVYT